MKRIVPVLFAVLLLGSCSDDFLEKNQRNLTMLSGKALISTFDADPEIEINLGLAGSEKYHIAYYPVWMVWESMHGKFENGLTTLKFHVEKPEWQPDPDFLTGTVVLDIDRIGLVGLEVVCGNIGNIPGQTYTRITHLSGRVKDAVMHQPTGTLAIATQYPNQLLLFRPATQENFTIPLQKSPQCLDFTEDGKTLLVGNTTAEISEVSLDTRSVVREYPLDCVAFDLVAGQNGWCYLSPQGDVWNVLRSLNLQTGDVIRGGQLMMGYLCGNVILKKVPQRAQIMGTRSQVGPTGVLQVDISRGVPNDTIQYWHMDITDFWVFRDGNRFLAKSGAIYPIPPFVASVSGAVNLSEVGRVQLPQTAVGDACFTAAGNTLFVVGGNAWQYGWPQGEKNRIFMVDVGNLSILKTWEPSFSALEVNGELVLAYNQVRYVFTDSQGSRIWTLRRTAPETAPELWSIEEFEVK